MPLLCLKGWAPSHAQLSGTLCPRWGLGADLILPARTGTSLCMHSQTGSSDAGAAVFKEEGRAGGPKCRVRAVSYRDEEGGRSGREGCREVLELLGMGTHQSRATIYHSPDPWHQHCLPRCTEGLGCQIAQKPHSRLVSGFRVGSKGSWALCSTLSVQSHMLQGITALAIPVSCKLELQFLELPLAILAGSPTASVCAGQVCRGELCHSFFKPRWSRPMSPQSHLESVGP